MGVLKKRYDELMQKDGSDHYSTMFQVLKELNEPEKMTLEKFIKKTCQDAWKQEGNTTINEMVAWIFTQILPPIVHDLEVEISRLSHELKELKNG